MDVIEKLKIACGTQRAIAKHLGLTDMAICQWRRRGKIPVCYVLKLEALSGGQVTRYEMRPDVYPIERVAA
jgi:DNA-binding transcriptional regulator YdaS (Cro superfamily)